MTAPFCLRIDPDGTVTRCEGEPMDLARREFGGLSTVLTLHHPATDFPARVMVGWIHDFGAVIPLEVNRKAWILYGGSPVFGPMFVADDERAPLDDSFVRMLESDEDWIGDEYNRAMDDWLGRLEMHE